MSPFQNGTNCRFLEFGTNFRLGRMVTWDVLSPSPPDLPSSTKVCNMERRLTYCLADVVCQSDILEAIETIEYDSWHTDDQNFASRVKLQVANTWILEHNQTQLDQFFNYCYYSGC